MILYISDFDLHSSGYMQLSIALCKELADRGKKVVALGLGYNRAEHNWPFAIIPVPHGPHFIRMLGAMWQNLHNLAAAGQSDPVEAVIVALDIPLQEQLLMVDHEANLRPPNTPRTPIISIFPVESGPMCATWASSMSKSDARLVISEYGVRMMNEAGVPSEHIPIGIDTESWRLPVPAERKALREAMGFTDDQMVVLTVADNQERKNLSAAAKAISILKESVDAQWLLCTRLQSPVGWKLQDLATTFGIADRLLGFERGLAFDRLWTLYAVADAFLLTSKAEGLCLPVMEAMASGVPVVATDCTAIPELLFSNPADREGARGLTIDVEYWHLDPWGNSMRAYCDPFSAAAQLGAIYAMRRADDPRLPQMIADARAYMESRTWAKAGDVLFEAVERVALKPKPIVPEPPPQVETPVTVPRPIPVPTRFANGGQA